MTVFARVVEEGSFARAAERLGLSTSACSRFVAELEHHLNTRLLNRTTRRLSLTEAGQAYLARCEQILADVEDAEAIAGAHASVPKGTIRITAPIHFGRQQLAVEMALFREKYPGVKFDVLLADRTIDLVEEGVDLAVRIGHLASEALIARPLGRTRRVACASPAYLERHGEPASPADLARHACLRYTYESTGGAWRFLDARDQPVEVRIDGPFIGNNGDLLVALAVAGAGIVLVPEFACQRELASGALRAIDALRGAPLTIYAVYPSRRQLSAKVRMFVDFLAQRFATGAVGPAVHAP